MRLRGKGWRRAWETGVAPLLLAPVLSVTALAEQQVVVPLGRELQINTYTLSSQENPDVGSDPDGNIVVTWNSFFQDGDSLGVFARQLTSEGLPLGNDFQVNTFTSGVQHQPKLAVCNDGKFVIVWQSNPYGGTDPQDGDDAGVFAQRFANDAARLGSEFQVNQYTTGNQGFPAVAKTGATGFVVTWHSTNKLGEPATGTQDGFSAGVFARLYSSNGAPISDEFQVNTYTAAAQNYPEVASAPAGNFLIVWRSNGQEGSFGLFGQRFASNGSPQGTEFQVNTYTVGIQERPSAAFAPNGTALVAWQSAEQDGQNRGVFAQFYASDGSPQGAEFQVNTFTLSYQGFADVASTEKNEFIVTWQSFGQGNGDSFDIFARRYASDGTPLTSEFQVNSYITGSQSDPVVATGPDDFSIIVWESEGADGSSDAIRAQRFGPSVVSPAPAMRPLGLFAVIVFLFAAGAFVLRRKSRRA